MEVKPSVGRIVHYTPPAGILSAEGKLQPYAATITHVWSDSTVNLSVHNDGSFPLPAHELTPTSVSAGGGFRSWAWPNRV